MSTTGDVQHVATSSITFLTGPLAGQTFQITKSVTTIGRDEINDIVVIGDEQVSPQHAQLKWKAGAWNVENLSQKSVLTVDTYAVQKAAIIQDESIITLGLHTRFAFHTSQEKSVFLDETPTQKAKPPQHPINAASLASTAQPSLDLPTSHIEPTETLTLDLASSAHAGPATRAAGAVPSAVLVADSQKAEGTQEGDESGPQARDSQTLVAAPLMLGIPSLEVSYTSAGGRKSYPLHKQALNIGRDPANDIVISDQIISGQHLQITREGNDYILLHPHPKREKTTNGLFYQGKKIRGGESFRKVLSPGDVFRIGDEDGTLVTLAYQDGSGTQNEALTPIHPIKLDTPELTIGRHIDNTVVLPNPQVSAHHAKLVREGGAYRVLDLHSTNHVYVNAQPVTNRLLKMGDELRIGPYRLVYETTQLVQFDESLTIRLDALNLTKTVKNRATLLNDISLSIPPRSFVALVGASGAGKSTLMDALNGLRPSDQGSVLYNGQDYYRNLAAFNMQIGYVPQDDIVHREITVERALFYAAKLRLPGDFTAAQIEQRITEVLEDVELTDRRQQLVKQLSGGQRKRVSLALELLANPGIFFLDEPTSGLDPGLDRKMMVLLRRLADKGHTIVLVTHATNNISVCDYVCFLARGGRLAYFGPPEDAKTYFGKPDFAEIYSALESASEHPNAPEEAEKRFKASQEYQTYIEQPLKNADSKVATRPVRQQRERTRRGDSWKQLVILTTRYLELLKNDPINLGILLLQAPIIAVLLVFFTQKNIFINTNGIDGASRSPLFLMVIAAIWFGTINAVREIVKEAPIYRRERAMHLGVIPYVLSKLLVLGFLCLLQSLVLLAVIGWKAGYPTNGVLLPPFLELYISLALTALGGLVVGLAVSAIAPNADRALSLVPLILLPEIIFSGAVFQLNGVLGTISDIMAARWGLAGLGGTLHLQYYTFCSPLPPVPQAVGIPSGSCPVGFVESPPDPSTAGFYPVDSQHLLLTWLASLILIILPLILTIYFQRRKDGRSS